MVEGPTSRFETLVREVSPRLLALARLYLGREHEAEDVVQEALARAWSAWNDRDVREHAPAWLARVVRNRCIDLLRARARTVALDGDVAAPLDDPAPTCSPHALAAVIRRLPEPYRTVILLRFSQKLPYESIALIMDVPVGTAKSQVCRAVRLLRAELAPTGALDDHLV